MKLIFYSCALCLLFFSSAAQQKSLVDSKIAIIEGVKLHDEEKYDEAIAKFLTVPANDTNYVLMLAELANSYLASDRDSLALIALNEGLRYPSELEVMLRVFKANALDNLGRFDEAVQVYDDGQKDFPRSHVFYYEKGVALMKKERYREAHDLFVKTIGINPYYHPAHIQMATLALKQGKYIPAMLAWQYALMFDNSSQRAKNIVAALEEMAKVEYEFKNITAIPGLEGQDDFAELEALVKSKIALSSKYKAKLKLNFALTRQIQLICEKIEVNKGDKGFYMQYYAPFFAEVNKNKMIEAFSLSQISGMGVESIDKIVAKKSSDMTKFQKWALDYIRDHHETFEDEVNGKKDKYRHFYSNSKLSAIGNIVNGKSEGYWLFFNPNGFLRSEGAFTGDVRTGLWKFYYEDGALKSTTIYKNGTPDGEAAEYYETGGLSSKLNTSQNILNGPQYIYYAAGAMKGEFNYVNGKQEGKFITYHINGKKKEEFTLLKDRPDGEFREYSSHGRLVGLTNYKGGMKEGATTAYYDLPDSPKRFEGNYVADKYSGKWTYYYNNGKMESAGEYNSKGLKQGKWLNYYENETVAEEEEYDNGKLNGVYKKFTRDGKLVEEFIYKNDILQQFKQYDIAGKEIASGKREKKELNVVMFHPDGTKRREGRVYDNAPEGEWKDYDRNGTLTTLMQYKAGILNGEMTGYHENGKIKYKVNYTSGEMDGYYQGFNDLGNLIIEGFYVAGQEQGPWINYYNNGVIKSRKYYLNGQEYGWQKYYSVVGKLDREDFYRDEFLERNVYYDTTGNVLNACYFEKGNGEYIAKNLNKEIIMKVNIVNSLMQGELTRYHSAGKISGINTFVDNENTGKNKTFDIDGNLVYEEEYIEDMQHGKAISYYPGNKKKDETNFRYDQRHGADIEYYENGKVKSEFNYENGQIHGETKYFSEDGLLVLGRKFDYGKILNYSYLDKTGNLVTVPLVNESGKFKAYYQNGNVSTEGEFINGMREGARKIYHSNGKVASDETYFNGHLHGTCTYYYASGKVKAVKQFNLGELHGKVTHYYENGKVEKEESYQNDTRHGSFKYYAADGKPTVQRNYYDGTLINEVKL